MLAFTTSMKKWKKQYEKGDLLSSRRWQIFFFKRDLLNREISKNTQDYKIVPLTNLP